MLLRWNMLFFDFCVRYLRLFDCFNTGKTVLPKNAKLDRHNGAAGTAPSWCCRNSAAKNAPSWAQVAKLAASMVQICQTCSKYGNPSHTWRVSGSTRQYDHARKVFSLYCWIVEIAYQQLSANPQAVVLLQGFSLLSASNTRNIKTTCYASSFV